MGNSVTNPTQSAASSADDRLDSWKEIAAYLKRDVTTVQRWEKREGMPVHRHLHDRLGTVYAFRADLDAWTRSLKLRHASDQEPSIVGAGTVGSPGPEIQDTTSAPGSVAGGSLGAEPVAPTGRVSRRVMIAAAMIAVVAVTFAFRHGLDDGSRRNPLEQARFERLTDFDGIAEAAAISRDGRFVAFLSDRDGPMDVWLTQLGTGQFHNLTGGGFRALVNPSVRTLGFSPDGSYLTFWTRKADGSNPGDIGIWAVPILGGQPRPYLEGAAEADWSDEGRLVYHTPGPGDPMFVREPGQESAGRQIFAAAAAGLHSHYLLWAPNHSFIYFVQGSLPDALDIWRIKPSGGAAEQITHHNSPVSHPVRWGDRTLLYLADAPDHSGPWIYSVDVESRLPRRISSGLERYTSLAASTDGRRLVATVASPKGTLWRMPLTDAVSDASAATRILLTTGSGSLPRLGPDYLLYVSADGAGDGIWRLAAGRTTELWNAPGVRIIGGPAITPDGKRIAFSTEQGGRTVLYMMDADGANARVAARSLVLQGAPAWAPDDGSEIVVDRVQEHSDIVVIDVPGR